MNLKDFLDKEYYIIDCRNFVFFPRKVRVIAFCNIGYREEIQFEIDVKESYSNEYRKLYLSELQQFKTFKEADTYARKLNEIPENKERAEKWNSVENQYNLYKMEVNQEE